MRRPAVVRNAAPGVENAFVDCLTVVAVMVQHVNHPGFRYSAVEQTYIPPHNNELSSAMQPSNLQYQQAYKMEAHVYVSIHSNNV